MKNSSPSTKDKSLPSFLHPLYLDVWDDLVLVGDCWSELKNSKSKYLPKEESEPDRAYNNRLRRSPFDSRFAPAIKGHAGLLSDFVLTNDAPQSVVDYQKNIDQQGNSLEVFFTNVDEMVLRDGGCGVLVEFPPQPTDEEGNSLIKSAADEQSFGLRPYLVAIDRRDILNWDVTFKQGRPVINRVVIRENRLVPDGDFGVEQKSFYRVLKPGSFEVWELKRQQDGKWDKILIEKGTTNLDRVPLVWYSISESKLFQAQPPFLNLARLNIEHLQKRSSLNEVLHKCNLPVPVRKGLITRGGSPDKPVPKLVIGPNSVVDIPIDGDFGFAEPTGSAIASTQSDIEKLEAAMDRVALAFLGGGEAQKTATEVMLDTAQAQATLKGLAARKRSAVEQIFDLWVAYTGESEGGSIEVNEKILQLPPNPQEVQVILDAMGMKISPELGLTMLLQIGWLPRDTDIKKEAQLTALPATLPQPSPVIPLVGDADIENERTLIAA